MGKIVTEKQTTTKLADDRPDRRDVAREEVATYDMTEAGEYL